MDNGKTEKAYVEDLMIAKGGSTYAGGGEVDIDEEFGDLYNAFAEKDSKTKKGISEEEDALAFAKKHGYKDLQESYDDGFHYWTEWYQDTPSGNGGYYTEDGKWIEVKKKGGKTYAGGGTVKASNYFTGALSFLNW